MKIRHSIAVVAYILIALFVPAPGFAEQQTYRVIAGDSLYKIAKQFKTTPETLKEINGLKSNTLRIGQILNVSPGGQPEAASTETAGADNSKQRQTQQSQQIRKETQTYVVRNGDTLSGIAKSFKTSVKNITAANNIKNVNSLKIGQVLAIPVESKTVAETEVAKSVEEEAVEPPSSLKIQLSFASDANQADSKSASNTDNLTVRDRLVEAGFNMLGIRYRFGGTSETTGLDCSALVKNLFEKFGLALPRTSREQYGQGEKVAKEDLQKGDLVFFSSSGKTPTHVGIYIGDNQFLHAASQAKKVTVSDLGKTWYDIRYIGARRIMELWREDAAIPYEDAPYEGLASIFDEK